MSWRSKSPPPFLVRKMFKGGWGRLFPPLAGKKNVHSWANEKPMNFRWATIKKYHFLTVSQKKNSQLILLASQQFLVGVYFKKTFVDLVVQYRRCTSQRLDGLHEWRESNHMSYENFRATPSSIADKWSCKILNINPTWRWTPATKISKMCDVGFGWMRVNHIFF